jgi:group I intron endonuclease
MTCGIYQIYNMVTGKSYVGQSIHIESRWRRHTTALGRGTHKNRKLQASWNKHGPTAFIYNILFRCERDKDILRLLEQEFMWKLDSFENGYNLQPVAGSPLGTKYTDEAREKMSAWQRGRKLSASHREAISASRTGEKSWWVGRTHSEEAKKRIGAASRERLLNQDHPWFRPKGWTHSDETKRKLSELNKGRRHSEETRKKMSEAQKKRKFSDEHRAKINAALRARSLRIREKKLQDS